MQDPVGAYEQLQAAIKKYITTAFRTSSPSFESDRRALLDTTGVLFQEAYAEPLPDYETGPRLQSLGEGDLPGLSLAAREAFVAVASGGLFRDGHALSCTRRRCCASRSAGSIPW